MENEHLLALCRDTSQDLTSEAALRRIYSTGPGETSLAKVADHIHPLYRPYIEASPFAVLATVGEAGLDTSPRGDAPGFITVANEHTLLLPDRRGTRPLASNCSRSGPCRQSRRSGDRSAASHERARGSQRFRCSRTQGYRANFTRPLAQIL